MTAAMAWGQWNPHFKGTPSGPSQVSSEQQLMTEVSLEWRLGRGLLIVSQHMKYFSFYSSSESVAVIISST